MRNEKVAEKLVVLARELVKAGGSKVAMSKPVNGKRMGTSDGAPPKSYTEEQLSRLYDAMYAAQLAGLNPKSVFNLAPSQMKLEWNYSKWTYSSANV